MSQSNKPLSGKVALVTGGARGIGRATVEKLAAEGASVAINYYNSAEEAEDLAKNIRDLGVEAITIQANVAEPNSVKELFDQFKNHFDRLDFLISNAASGVLKPNLEMTLKHFRWCMETNAFALNNLVQESLSLMQPGSRVLAISSMGAHRAIPQYGFIGASKAALEAIVRSLSVELAPYGISVNTISAGAVDTDALKYFPNREQLLEKSKAMSLSGKNIEPKDVADVVYLLCLPESFMIRGQTIFVDAGYSIIC